MKKNKIFIACDTSNINLVKKIISQTKTNKLEIIPKFGLQFFYSKQGRRFLEKFNNNFFLDLKINDIKQTALSAIDSLKDLKKCKYITVHANGGLEMLKAVKKKAKKTNKNPKILGVTVLTSLNNKSLKEIGHTKTLDQLVLKQVGLIKKAGLHGIVLSAKEAKIVKELAIAQIPKNVAVRIEYLELVDPENMQPVELIAGPVLAAGAAWVGTTRLIDNVICNPIADTH